jgi:hypothetical protein
VFAQVTAGGEFSPSTCRGAPGENTQVDDADVASATVAPDAEQANGLPFVQERGGIRDAEGLTGELAERIEERKQAS